MDSPASKTMKSNSSQAIIRRYLYLPAAAAAPAGDNQPNGESSAGPPAMDGTRVISKECYEDWLNTRDYDVKNPERTFQRILTSHLTATDGRTPFTPEEEVAILDALRLKRIWPAFEGTRFNIGSKGFRSLGFNEKKAMGLSVHTTNKSAALASTPNAVVEKRGKKRIQRATNGDATAAAATRVRRDNHHHGTAAASAAPASSRANTSLPTTRASAPNAPLVAPPHWQPPQGLNLHPFLLPSPPMPSWFAGSLSMPHFAHIPRPPLGMADIMNMPPYQLPPPRGPALSEFEPASAAYASRQSEV